MNGNNQQNPSPLNFLLIKIILLLFQKNFQNFFPISIPF